MDLLIWILILGIALIVIATVIALIQALNARQITFLSHITLSSFAIVFLLAGFGALGAFAVLGALSLVFGTLNETLILTSLLAIVGGGIIGGGIASKSSKKKRMECELDPNCSFT